MGHTFIAPRSHGELGALLREHDDVAIVGGAVGLMSAAMPPLWAEVNIDLAELGIDWCTTVKAGAMATLSTVEAMIGGRPAVQQALKLTATPALRGLITMGGVLAARDPRSDLPVALAAHDASARVMSREATTWLPVIDLWRLAPPFVVLEVDFGTPAKSCYARFTGHHRAAPAIVSVAARERNDGSVAVCIGSALPTPQIVDPLRLPGIDELVGDHLASAAFRYDVMRRLVADACARLNHEMTV